MQMWLLIRVLRSMQLNSLGKRGIAVVIWGLIWTHREIVVPGHHSWGPDLDHVTHRHILLHRRRVGVLCESRSPLVTLDRHYDLRRRGLLWVALVTYLDSYLQTNTTIRIQKQLLKQKLAFHFDNVLSAKTLALYSLKGRLPTGMGSHHKPKTVSKPIPEHGDAFQKRKTHQNNVYTYYMCICISWPFSNGPIYPGLTRSISWVSMPWLNKLQLGPFLIWGRI